MFKENTCRIASSSCDIIVKQDRKLQATIVSVRLHSDPRDVNRDNVGEIIAWMNVLLIQRLHTFRSIYFLGGEPTVRLHREIVFSVRVPRDPKGCRKILARPSWLALTEAASSTDHIARWDCSTWLESLRDPWKITAVYRATLPEQTSPLIVPLWRNGT